MRRMIGVALGVPEPWGGVLDRYRRDAGDPKAGCTPPHVTLLCPINVDTTELGRIEEHLDAAATAHRPFPLHLRGPGTFRPVTDVVFVAVTSGLRECEALERDIRRGPLARDLSYPYHPHVTVAHDVPSGQLDQAYERLAGFEARFLVPGFTLFEHGADGRWRPRRDFLFPSGTDGHAALA